MKDSTRRAKQLMALYEQRGQVEDQGAFDDLLILAYKHATLAEIYESPVRPPILQQPDRAARHWKAFDKLVRVTRSLLP